MFEPTGNELANLLTKNKDIGPRRLDIFETESNKPEPYRNKAEDLVNTIMEYKNEITFGRRK